MRRESMDVTEDNPRSSKKANFTKNKNSNLGGQSTKETNKSGNSKGLRLPSNVWNKLS